MRKIIHILILSMAFPTLLCAVDFETPNSIKRILDDIGYPIPESREFYCNSLPGKPLLYVVSFEKAIVQAGVRLFSDKIRGNVDSVICDCVERTWLELLLCKDIAEQKKLLGIKHISMAVNGMPLGSKQFPTLTVPMEIIQTAETFDFKSSSEGFSLRFSTKSESFLTIRIPSDPAVIFAFDKKEHESYLFRKLSTWDIDFIPKRTDYPGLFSEEGKFKVSGGRHYLIDSLSNNIYFLEYSPKNKIVYDRLFPMESLRNLGMGALPSEAYSGIFLNILQKTYGNGHNDFLISFSGLLGFMQQCGMDFYSAEYSANSALFIFHHPEYQFIHMLTVSIPENTPFPSRCTLSAELMSYIPQNYISNLFNILL